MNLPLAACYNAISDLVSGHESGCTVRVVILVGMEPEN